MRYCRCPYYTAGVHNRLKILKRLKQELFYGGLSRDAYQKVSDAVWESNRTAIIVWSIFVALFWIMSLVMSLNSEAYKACRTVYIIALIICAVTLVGAIFPARRTSWILFPFTVLFVLSLHGAGIGIAIYQPDVRTVTLIVFSAITPISTIKRTSNTIAIQFITILSYALLAKDVIEPDIYSWGLTNLIIFSVAGIMVGHFVNRERFERYVYEDSAKQFAEVQMKYAYHDQLTGLKNRRAYSEALERMQKNIPQQLCVVMVDVNGLKQVNDNLGHTAGDELIIAAATCLSAAFEDIATIYRIGGDEFCVTMTGKVEEALHHLEKLDRLAAEWSGQFIMSFSVSYGVESSQGYTDVDAIVKEADRRMYEHKRNYYLNSGFDRRKR